MQQLRLLHNLVLCTAVALASTGASAAPGHDAIGLQLPSSGIDGAAGLRMRDAVLVAVDDLRAAGEPVELVAPAGAVPVQNPHQDEGSDNDDDVTAGPGGVRTLAARGIHVIVGPLRSNVAVADEPALAAARSAAITGTAGEPYANRTRVFKVVPSDRQLAAAAAAWIRLHFGPNVCVLDDGTRKARRQSAAILDVVPGARYASHPDRPQLRRCLAGVAAVYLAALAAEPVFCSSATARKAGPTDLLAALSLRSFDPARFASAGRLWRAEPAPIARPAQLQGIINRYHRRAFVAADDAALRFYAATQIAAQAAARGGDPVIALRSLSFRTILGRVRFNAKGEPAQPRIAILQLN